MLEFLDITINKDVQLNQLNLQVEYFYSVVALIFMHLLLVFYIHATQLTKVSVHSSIQEQKEFPNLITLVLIEKYTELTYIWLPLSWLILFDSAALRTTDVSDG